MFNLQGGNNYTLLNRVFVLRGAMAETKQSHVNFHMSPSNHCGSLLKANELNTFWCWATSQELVVTVFRLENLLDMIPNSTLGIASINVKIDAEGADLLVLKGGGKALERVSSVIIECGEKNLECDDIHTKPSVCRLFSNPCESPMTSHSVTKIPTATLTQHNKPHNIQPNLKKQWHHDRLRLQPSSGSSSEGKSNHYTMRD